MVEFKFFKKVQEAIIPLIFTSKKPFVKPFGSKKKVYSSFQYISITWYI